MVIQISVLTDEANRLREAGKFEEALKVYRQAWSQGPGPMSGAGLLHCLRKLRRFREAFSFAEILQDYSDGLDWPKSEVIWTHIDAEFKPLLDDPKSSEVIPIAEKILAMRPDKVAKNYLVLKVCRVLKDGGQWKELVNWCDQTSPETLSMVPIQNNGDSIGWCRRSIWYNYKITGLIKTGKYADVIQNCNTAIEMFPSQFKIFQRDRALAYSKLRKYQEAADDYRQICVKITCDWWLLDEYSLVLSSLGNNQAALSIACKAALTCKEPSMMVNTLERLSNMFHNKGEMTASRDHLALSIGLRKSHGWKVSDASIKKLSMLNKSVNDGRVNDSIDTLLQRCNTKWLLEAKSFNITDSDPTGVKRVRKECRGRIALGFKDRDYAFIEDNSRQSYHCIKSDLPAGIRDNDVVIFDAYPSLDKKKGVDAWKAKNIRLQKAK